jgi:23S rRNA pseudouridine1911/1915/1917 synthase
VELAAARRLPRQALHAQRLGFIHPTSGEKAVFGSQVPEDMAVLIETCFGLEVLESLGP